MIERLRAWMREKVKQLLVAAAVLAVLGIFGALFVMISGIVPIKASSGHWSITEAFLQFAKRRSVATHTVGMKVPPLDEERLVLQGGGQYGFACEPCHGSPSIQQPRIAASMLPKPPDLRRSVLTYGPEELFYIVKHGIKLTGMPAWPAGHRDDEVWAMVAFLQRLPSLEAQAYEELTGRARTIDDAVPLEELLGPTPLARKAIGENCARCHGVDGLGGPAGAFPKLAGQRAEYLAASLEAYARGARHSGVMEPIAARLGLDDMRAIGEYYARRPAAGGHAEHGHRGDPEGRRIAEEGIPAQLIPACSECHGPAPAPERNANYPLLAGQHAWYLESQLRLFRQKGRGGTRYHEIMHKIAGQLSDEQVRAVAAYYASIQQ
ncbi:MAG TPA: c-type cytochrome [Vicinamibacterales bacterium]|nr:c-type cytochrome [Vicinamibacterales bacterium]